MHTPNINCCRPLFSPASGLLFIPLWQSWECLLGSHWCQASVGRRPLAAAPPAAPAATCTAQAILPSDYTWQGGWSQPRSAQCSPLLHSGVTHQIGESLGTALLSETPLPHPPLSLSSSQMAELHEALLAHFCSRFFIRYLSFSIKSSHTSILTSAS